MRPGEAEPTVVVIDDDEEIREGLQGLFGSVGLRAWRSVCPRSASWPGRISLASSLSSARSPTILTHRRDRMDIARPWTRFPKGRDGLMSGKGFFDWEGRSPKELFRERDRKLIALKRAMRDIGTVEGR